MENGQINWNDETLVKYGNNWFYVKNGQVGWNYSGDCRYDGTFYTVKNGVMTGVDEGKIWKYDTRYAYNCKNIKWADGTWIMDAELDRIDKILYEKEIQFYLIKDNSTKEEIQAFIDSIPDDVKYACIYLAAGGDNFYYDDCDVFGWSY